MIQNQKGRSHSVRSKEDLLDELRRDVSRLNPDELETFKLLLEELQQPSIPEGERILDVLQDAEYEREPVDVETFIMDEYFLGKTCAGVYPRWLEALKELFSGGYNEAVFTGAIGCVALDTVFVAADGSLPTVRESLSSDPVDVVCPSLEGNRISPSRRVMDSGVQECVRVELAGGTELVLTPDHRIRVWRGGDHCWVQAHALVEGDMVCVARRLPEAPGSRLTSQEAELLGFWAGNGDSSSERRWARFSGGRLEACDRVAELLHVLFPTPRKPYSDKDPRQESWTVLVSEAVGSGFLSWLDIHRLLDRPSPVREVPPDVGRSSNDVVAAFLRGLYGCEGCVYPGSAGSPGRINLGMTSRRIIEQVRLLLLRFGVLSRIYTTVSGRSNELPVYTLTVSGKEPITSFLDHVGTPVSKEEEVSILRKQLDAKISNTNVDVVPVTAREVFGILRGKIPVDHPCYRLGCTPEGRRLSRRRFDWVCSELEHLDEIRKLALQFPDHVGFAPVLSVEPAGMHEVGDVVSVEAEPAWLASGVHVHNTGKTFAASIGVCRLLYELSCLRDPCKSLGLAPGSTISIANMCLGGDTEIYDGETCERRTLEESVGRGRTGVFGFDGTQVQPSHGSDVVYTGDQRLFRLTTSTGRSILATADHKFLEMSRGWIRVEDLFVGGVLALATSYSSGGWVDSSISDSELKLLAYLITEGCTVRKNSVSFSNTNELIFGEYTACLDALGVRYKVEEIRRPDRRVAWIAREVVGQGRRGVSYKVAGLCEAYGLLGKHSWEKRIPSEVLQLPLHRLGVFLNRMFGGDGGCHLHKRPDSKAHQTWRNYMFRYTSTSEQLANDVIFALGRFGIFACKKKGEGKKRPFWRVDFNRSEFVKTFMDSIGTFGKEFQYEGFSWRGHHFEVGDICWDEVVSIEDVGVQPTYCVTNVVGNPWYVANGFITHNSVNETLARKVVFENIGAKIKASPYFSEHFKYEDTQKEMRFPKHVWLTARATTDHSVLGMNLISAILDECARGTTRILLGDGTEAKVEDLLDLDGFRVQSFDFETNTPIVAEAYLKPSVSKECLELTLDNGQTFSVSWDHPVAVRKEDGVLAFVSLCDIVEHQEVVIYASEGTEAIRGSQEEDQRSSQEAEGEGQPVSREEAHRRGEGEDGRSSQEAPRSEALRRDESEDARVGERQAEVGGAEAQAVRNDEASVLGGCDRIQLSGYGWPCQSDVRQEADAGAEGSHRRRQPGEAPYGRGQVSNECCSVREADAYRGVQAKVDRVQQESRLSAQCGDEAEIVGGCCCADSTKRSTEASVLGDAQRGCSGLLLPDGVEGDPDSGGRSRCGSLRVRTIVDRVYGQKRKFEDDCSGFSCLVDERDGSGCRSEILGSVEDEDRFEKNRLRSGVLRSARLGLRGVDRVLSVGRVVSTRRVGTELTYSICVPGYEVFVADGVLVHNTNFMHRKEGKKTLDGRRYGMVDQAESLYTAMKRRMKSRFEKGGKLPGMLFVVSSKQTNDDFTARRIREAINDPHVLVRDFCLTGDTRIPLLDGTEPTIYELVRRYGGTDETFEVYSFDPKAGRIVPGEASHPRLTAEKERVLEIELDSGEVVRATPWHPFMLKSGEFRRAEELQPGDSLMPLYRRIDKAGYEEVGQPWWGGRWQKTHHMAALARFGRWPRKGRDGLPVVVHHENFDKQHARNGSSITEVARELGCSPSAISNRLKRAGLPSYSELKRAAGHKSPGNHKVVEVREGGFEDVYDLSVECLENFAVGQGVFVHNSLWDVKPSHYSDKKFFVLCGNESIPSRVLDEGEESRYSDELEPENCVLIEVPEDFRADFESDLEGCLTGDTLIPLLDGTEVPIEALVGREEFWTYSYTPDGRFCPGRGRDARLTRKNAKLVQVTLDNGEVVRCTSNHLFMLRSGEYKEAGELQLDDSLMPLYWRIGQFETCSRCQQSLREDGNNHKAVSVEPAGRADVYDITVEGVHNFALSAGVVVHNSIRDIAGVATVSVNPYIQRRDKISVALRTDREHPFSVLVYDPSRGGSFMWDRLVDTKMVRGASGMQEPAWKPRLNPDAPRHVHIDPSLRGDATGFCMSHISGYKQVLRRAEDGRQFAERAPVYTVDLVLQIVPPIGGEIVLGELRHLVYDLSAHGFMITCVSLDSWNCLAGGTRVATSRGLIPIEEVQPGDSVVSREGPARVLSTFAYPETETFRIETTDGETLEGTGKHRIEAATYYEGRIRPESIRKYRTGPLQGEPRWEWIRLDKLQVGQVVRMVSPDLGSECLFVDMVPLSGDKRTLGCGAGGSPGMLNAWELPDHMTPELAEWLGLIWGDGDIGEDSIRLTLTEEEYPSAVRVYSNLFGFCPNFYPGRGAGVVCLSARWLLRWLHLNGLDKPLVPEAVLRSPALVQAAFLRGLFATDGWVSSTDGGAYLSSANLGLVLQVQVMLRSVFGIESCVMDRFRTVPLPQGGTANAEEHVLCVRGSRSLFLEKIGFSYQRKNDLLQEHAAVPGRRIFTRVERILPGRSKVFDLEVEGDPSYTANGFVSHNSADTIQQMKQRGYRAEVQSVDITPEPYDNLKTALYEDRILAYEYSPLQRELETLQEDRRGNRRKIDHPPTGSKDVADALAGCLFTLSKRSVNQPLPLIQHSSYAQDPWMPEQQQAVRAGMLDVRLRETMPPIMFGTSQDDSWVTGGGRKQ